MEIVLLYVRTAVVDNRLNCWHVSLLFAILYVAFQQQKYSVVRVSRARLMKISHINTLPTYHKYFKDLQLFGYIGYRPSYHPGIRSEVDLILSRKVI